MEGFGRVARANLDGSQTPWRCIDGIAAEAARKVGAASHVKGNIAAHVIFGDNPMIIAAAAIEQSLRAMSNGRKKIGKLAATANTMFACVASHPASAAERVDNPDFLEHCQAWLDRLFAFEQRRWGAFRLSIVEHRYEEHWQIHILILPPLDSQN